MKSSKKNVYIFDIILLLILIILDRCAKYYALTKLKERPSVPVINGFLEFRYLENKGAAFGLLKNQTSFFIFVSVIVFCAIIYIIIRAPKKKRYLSANICLIMIAAGASGNMFDRVLYKHVIDFIYISIIRFPVFNVADTYITFATFLLVILIIFKFKEEDFNFFKFKEKRLREINNE